MKRKIFFSVLFTVMLLIMSAAAMAGDYKVKVIIDGSAIMPDKEVEVYFTLKKNFHELYWVGYDSLGRCKSLRTTTYTYPHTFDQNDCSVTVTFNEPLLKIEATTPYGTKPRKSFGNGLSEWKIIGIRKKSIDD
jgi:hypothetical protein